MPNIVVHCSDDPETNAQVGQQVDAYLGASSSPKTRAELLFLKTFSFPTELDEIRRSEFWREALGAAPESIVSGFVQCGFLEDGSADVARLLQSKSKGELKSLAKLRGISPSGTKEDLANKLFKSDPSGISELFRGKTYFTCTPKGRLVVEKFEQSEKELRLKAGTETESALRGGRYKDACITVSSFEASQVFPRGVGIDWKRYDAERDVEILDEIAAYSPTGHRSIPQSIIPSLRIGAGMMNLWGESNPLKWLTGSEREFAHGAQIMLHAAISKVNLRQWKRLGFRQVRLLSSGRSDVCKTCKEAGAKTYLIDSVPDLPHEKCSCEHGCGCTLIAVA